MEQAKLRIDALREQLNRHNYNYYVLNAPEISDYDFDMLLKELEKLEKEYPQYDDPLSPTHRVGSDISKTFSQYTHQRPMLSLGNTYSINEVKDFMRRTHEGLMGQEFEIVGEMKFDGTSISLTYQQGRLIRAVTRGDGEKGDIVTDNVMTIRSIPLQLQGDGWPEDFEIRGEIVMPWTKFEQLNAERQFNEEPLFANPRNAASGTLKLQNSAEVAKRGLDAYFYYMLGDNLPCDNHFDNMALARQWGFKVSDIMTRLKSIQEVDDFINHWDTARKELPVATDGLVFKVNNLRQQLNLGYTAKSPRWAIAYKFKAERALTQLKHVSFEVGRTGVITPVANLQPVLLSGTIVKRASLHNEDIIRTLDIHDGDMVYVEKGGEIIPKITGVDISQRQSDAQPVAFASNCPSCGSQLIRVDGEAAWMCPNKNGCQPQLEGRIEHFVGRRMMNIEGIGEEVVSMLFNQGLIHSTADLYQLHNHKGKIEQLPGFGSRSADKLFDAIETSKIVPFERVVYALSIPYVGETVAKKLARAMHDIDSIINADIETLTAIDDIGPRIAESIKLYFADPSNVENVNRLKLAGVTMQKPDTTDENTSNILAGKSIVISGTFSNHSRDEYKEIIERNGGKNVSSISKKTDFVLAGENMGPAKLEKAQSLGIDIINEEQFINMLQLS